MTCKEGQFDVAVELSINLNAQNVNGMTHFDLTRHSRKLVKMHVRLLDTLKYMYCSNTTLMPILVIWLLVFMARPEGYYFMNKPLIFSRFVY